MGDIRLMGFGDFDDNETGKAELAAAAKKAGLIFEPTYYDHELRGDADKIEQLTMDLWSMPRDQWGENGLTEEAI